MIKMSSNTILVIGNCGVGKTWLMKELIEKTKSNEKGEFGMIKFNYGFLEGNNKKICILGNYTGDTFEGSDKLSMAVSRDFNAFFEYKKVNNFFVIAEGDRFTNRNFIKTFKPTIVKINGDGLDGRVKRKSNQTESHLKRISTRVSNIESNYNFNNSDEAYSFILEFLNK